MLKFCFRAGYIVLMIYWSELRTALIVARLGTVSAAAEEIGVHRATVHRHIDLLESALSAKLFQRHSRGYVLTDQGREMLDVASKADEMFAELAGMARRYSSQLSGELVITAVDGILSLITPTILLMRQQHPDVSVELIAEERLSKLEFGEAHIAFRAGLKPTEPDYVVRRFRSIQFGLYASKDYIAQFGCPEDGKFTGHKFVGTTPALAARPYSKWLDANISPYQVAVRAGSRVAIHQAILAGLGLGFMAEHEALDYPELVEVVSPSPEVSCDLWIVTHVDLHRSPKVQAFLDVLKARPANLKRAS